MDVELFARWAYQEELTKRAPAALAYLRGQSRDVPPSFYDGPRPPRAAGSALGNLVGGGSMDVARRPIGTPHPDALAFREAVDGLGDLHFPLLDDEALDIDMQGFGTDLGAEWAKAVRGVAAGIGIHARLGTRPALRQGRPVAEKVVGRNGKPVMVRQAFGIVVDGAWQEDPGGTVIQEVEAPPIRAGVYPVGAYAKLRYTPEPQAFISGRAEYAAWRMALNHIAATLALDGVILTETAAAHRPWLGDQDANRVRGHTLRAVGVSPPAKQKVFPLSTPRRKPSPVRHIKPSAA